MLITVQRANYASHNTCKNIHPTTNYGWTYTHNKYKPSRRSHTNINATSISKRNYKPNVLKECHTLYMKCSDADDLTLISPTCEGLQKMINMVEKYRQDKGLNICVYPNPQKSKLSACLLIGSRFL